MNSSLNKYTYFKAFFFKLRYNSHNIKFTTLKFRSQCFQCTTLIPKHFHHDKKKPHEQSFCITSSPKQAPLLAGSLHRVWHRTKRPCRRFRGVYRSLRHSSKCGGVSGGFRTGAGTGWFHPCMPRSLSRGTMLGVPGRRT